MQWLMLLFMMGAGYSRADFRAYISQEGSSEETAGQASGARSTSCPCGWTNKARIVGGKETLPNEYPLQVAIMTNEDQTWCGGSIVTDSHVLTASHCTYPQRGNRLYVIVGGHNVKSGDGNGESEKVDVEYTIEHEKYDPNTLEYDIALMVLSRPLQFNQYIGPVCFPTQKPALLNQYVKVLGWGLLETRKSSSSTTAKTSDVLMKVNIRVTEIENCQNSFPFQPIDGDKQMCTFRRAKDSCGGDSGGPLLWLDPETNRLTQVALVSYGRACGKRTPAINTDIFYYIQWIEEKIQESNKGGSLCHKV